MDGSPRGLRRALRSIVYLAVPLSAWPIIAWLHSGVPSGPGVITLAEAEFVPSSSAASPGAAADWRPRSLPDDWRESPTGTIEGWYRLSLPAGAASTQRQAIYLRSFAMNAAVYFDGELLGDGGSFDEPVARNWNRPLLFPYPAHDPAAHTLLVRIGAEFPDRGFLDRIFVGPSHLLAKAHARRRALKVTAVWVITLCLVLVGLFNGMLWLQWRRDAFYGWYALAALAWAGIHAEPLIVNLPVSTQVWYGFWSAAVIWFGLLNVIFVLSFIGELNPRVERRLLGLGSVLSVLLVTLGLTGAVWLPAASRFGFTLVMAVGAYSASRVVETVAAQATDPRVVVPHLLGLTGVVCVLHDWLWFVGLYGRPYEYFLPYAAPVVLVGMGTALFGRFVGALRQAEALVQELESRVARKREEVGQSHERLREIEERHALAEERERVMREMHDGLGSHLVSTLALIERDGGSRRDVGHAVRSALEDLRLMIDSLEPVEGDLLAALAMLRARMQPRLEAGGVRVAWHAEDLPPLGDFGPQKVLQVLRILQEALTNILKHAAASRIAVRSGRGAAPDGQPAVFVEIADDGKGLPRDLRRGRGLDNMHSRARVIGAALEIGGRGKGTTVRLWIPLVEEAPR